MKKLTYAEISLKRVKLEEIHLVNKLPVTVVLHNIRSTYNVGSIFRTSDGAMIEKLFLCGYTPQPPKKEILKTALGATDSIYWEYVKDTITVVKELKKNGLTIYALEQTRESKPYNQLSIIKFPMALIIGNEISGVSQEILDYCDYALEIPQYGVKHSLNVAVAYGITIFRIREIFDNIINNF